MTELSEKQIKLLKSIREAEPSMTIDEFNVDLTLRDLIDKGFVGFEPNRDQNGEVTSIKRLYLTPDGDRVVDSFHEHQVHQKWTEIRVHIAYPIVCSIISFVAGYLLGSH